MRKILIAGCLSNGLEWYDFALYACNALILSKLFFPAGDATAHLLATFGIFAVGFVARPFGGVLFGFIGDRYGRRKALALAVFMMAIPTGCIGLLPTYEHIGILAPILLTFIRLLQGLSLGGAFTGAMTFLTEHAPQGKRGIVGSASLMSLALGFMLGSLAAWLVKIPLTDLQYESWGWRIPFLLGVGIGLTGFYIRNHCDESPSYQAASAAGTLSQTPFRDTLRHERITLLQAVAIYITVTMPFYLLSAYFIAFTEHALGRSKEEALGLGVLNMLILFILSPCSAWVSDKIGRRKVLAAVAVGFAVFAFPIFMLLTAGDFTSILLAQSAFAALVGLYIGPIAALLVEIFPTRVRYTAMSLSYNIAAAVFGGTAPMVCEWLVRQTGTIYSVPAYVVACACTSLIALYFYRERFKDAL